MNTQQIELGFNQTGGKTGRRPSPQQQRRNRARWWFGQMRLVVEGAIDWKTVPPPPPQQTYLALASGKS